MGKSLQLHSDSQKNGLLSQNPKAAIFVAQTFELKIVEKRTNPTAATAHNAGGSYVIVQAGHVHAGLWALNQLQL